MRAATSNENGSILISALILLPFLLIATLGAASLVKFVHKKRELQWKCETAAIAVQREQAKNLRGLLSLNPMAKVLQKKRKVAERALKWALKSKNPKLIAAAGLYLAAVKTKQLTLRGKQKLILANANAIWNRYSIKSRFKAAPQRVALSYPDQLPVHPRNRQSGSPTYHPAKNFSQRQTHSVGWTAKINIRNPLLIKVIKSKYLTIPVECGGTLKARSKKWVPVLSLARPA